MTDVTGSPVRGGRTSGIGRLVRVRMNWIATVTLVAAASAAAFSWSQPPVYQSAADVVVLSLVSPGTPPPPVPVMATEKELVSSDVVASVASRRLGIPTGQLRRQAAVAVPVDTQILEITCSAADPTSARTCAQGLAEAYVEYKDTQPINTIPERGRVVTPAPLPLSPSAPNLPLNVAAGLLVGLVLGFLIALLRDRLDDRIRGVDELEGRGMRVFGTPADVGEPMHASALTPDLAARSAEAYGAIGEKLLLATLRTARPSPRRRAAPMLVLTGVETDRTRAAALALATALACGGDRAVLVDADTRAAGEIGADDDAPGLLDVLAGRASLASAMRDTGVSTLTLIGVGGRTPDAAVQVGTRTWTETATALTESFDHVVVAVAPLLASADAARILQPANAVVLVVDSRRTTRRALDRTIGELAQFATPLIGCIMTTRQRRSRGGGTAARAWRSMRGHPQDVAAWAEPVAADQPVVNGHPSLLPRKQLPDNPDRSLTSVGDEST